MATKSWTGGANDSNFMTAANWSDGIAPANSDTLIVGATNQTINGQATGLTGITLKVFPGFGGTIGVDTPLTFGSLTLLHYAGTGAKCVIGCTGTVTASESNHTVGEFVISTGTWSSHINGIGMLTIAAAAVVTALQNAGGTVTAGYNATAFTTLTTSGTVTSSRVATTATVLRGTYTQRDNGTSNFNTHTTVNVHNGATYNKQSGGTDTTVNAYPGSTFTIYGTSGGAAASVTVTTLNEWGGSIIKDSVPGLTLTIGTRNRIGATALNGGSGFSL
jgi:hypothetical protein